MISEFYLQIVGYIASAFILISFISKEIILIRTLSLLGALLFTFYSIAKHDSILCFVNASVAIINLVHIYKLKRNGSN